MGRSSRFYPWFVVGVLIVVYTSNFIDRTILSLLVGPIRADFEITDTEYSFLAGFAFALLYAIAAIPMGIIADRTSRVALLSVGCAFWSLMTALCGLTNSFWQLFAARVGVGIGEATLVPSAYSLLADYFSKERLARAMSFYTLGIPLGSGIALIIGGTVVDLVSSQEPMTFPVIGTPRPWQIVFFIIGLPGLLLAAVLPILIKEPPRLNTVETASDYATASPARFEHFWANKGVYFNILMVLSFTALISYSMNTWLPTYLQRVHSFTIGEAGRFLGTTILTLGIIGTISAGFLTDFLINRGRKDAHFIVALLYVGGMVTCGVIGPMVSVPAISLVFIGALSFFSFTWTGVLIALMQIITPNRMRGRISAVALFSANLIGLGIGPTAVAAATDYLFQRDEAVGLSLAIVTFVAGAISLACLLIARKLLGGSKIQPVFVRYSTPPSKAAA